MTYSSTLTSKNQTTLPKAVVALLGVKPSAILSYEVLEDGGVRLTAKSASFADHLASFPKKKPKRPVSLEMIDQAIQTEAAKHYRKSKS
jgi:antitoxin PrlF